MAQRTEVVLTDDLDGTDVRGGKGETVTFALDGKSYQIDLTNKNASALRKTLKPYVEAGRKVSGSRSRSQITRTRVGPDARTVKEWARANGHQVKDRGRVSRAVMEAFAAAN